MEFVRKISDFVKAQSSFYRWSVLFYLAILAVIIPWHNVFSLEPSTGGDVGSHFYPVYAMLESFSIRPWNPGNLAGEPLLVHYFPLPFIVMALLGLVIPAGFAFNWIYILSVILFPFSIYYYLKKIKAPGPSAEFGFLITIIFIFNTSYTAWGGNFFSTLAGQFCHVYALIFLFMFMGVMHEEVQKKSLVSIKGSFLVAGIILSHAYIALCLPIAVFSILLTSGVSFKDGFKKLVATGFVGTLFTVWWLIPFLTNNAWTTPYESQWLDNLGLFSYLPTIFWLPILLGFTSVVSLFSNPRGRELLLKFGGRGILASLFIAVLYFSLIKIFPLIGLVDIRAIPQIQIFIGVMIAINLGIWLELANKKWKLILSGCSLLITFVLIQPYLSHVSLRLHWNWSSWSTKKDYANFMKVNNFLKGDFSQPRVAYEHSKINSQAGTIRAWEMLPYFSGRATNESLYMQATLFAPYAFYFEGLLGEDKSCPYPQVPCPKDDLGRAVELMPILGVSELILATKESQAKADSLNALEKTFHVEPWSVYKLKKDVSLVEAIQEPMLEGPKNNWKKESIKYVLGSKVNSPWFFIPEWTHESLQKNLLTEVQEKKDCSPEVKLEWNTIKIKTNCIGVPHVIKSSFHPSFKASNGDPLFLILPGYIGIVPSTNVVELKFGQSLDWSISRWISLISFVLLAIYLFKLKAMKSSK